MSARNGEAASSRLRISEKLRRAASQPCAIVGMACRLPGAPDLDQLHQLLRAGREGISEAPRERWQGDEFASGQPGAPGQLITRRGGFVEGLDQFASDFFDISPREAAAMDPQQRLLLEVTWEALEAAGISPPRLARTRTAVLVGVSAHDSATLRSREVPDGFSAPGGALSVAAGRISYALDLRGPSLVIDTACSSSLVAFHQAWASLQRGESDAALVCGVNVLLDARVSVALGQSGMLAPDGRCKTFDDRANGYVRSEGCAVLVLKRLRDAERDGDPVLAVVRGSSVNHDGRTQGLTAPSGVAQRAVIRQALAEAGVEPGDVQVMEAHGTGTPLGDPQELDSIGDVFAGRERRLVVGSIKTNLGHLEAVAGLAGLLKVVLGLQNREIYPHLNLRRTNREIPLDQLPVSIPTELRPWPAAAPGRSRIGVVSSFGFSGTNAHVVLEEPPRPAPLPAGEAKPASSLPLVLSARSDVELRALAARHAAHLRRRPGLEVADLCHSAATTRATWAHRCVIPVSDRGALVRDLDEVAGGRPPAGALVGKVRRGPPPAIAFLFTGQGAQRPCMAAGLFAEHPVFHAALERCAELFRAELPLPLLDVLVGSSEAAAAALDDTLYTQPALFATGWALAQLWRSCGIEPAVVLGHSVGEITAACVSGALELEDAARFIAARARLMQQRMATGAMLAVLGPVVAAEQAVARRRDELSIAAYNGPSLTVVSGTLSAVAEVEAELVGRGVRTRRLRTARAFHSPLVEPILGDIERAAAAMRPTPTRCRLASNVHGSLFAPGDGPTGAYWAHQARQPVRFADNLRAALDHGCTVLVELGPDPVLLGMARAIAPDGVVSVASLRQGTPDRDAFLHAAGALHVQGAPLEWGAADTRAVRRRVPLPSYPFARRRFALPRRAPGGALASQGSVPAPQRVASPAAAGGLRPLPIAIDLPVAVFELDLAVESLGMLADHRVAGSTMIPAAALLELMLASARDAFGASHARLEQVSFTRPLVCLPGQPRRAVVSLTRSGRDGAAVLVASQPAGAPDAWTPHADARLSFGREAQPPITDASAFELLRAYLDEPAPVDELYRRLAERGLDYGPRLRGLVQAFPGDAGTGEALGRVAVPDAARLEPASWLHPVLLDSAFHLTALALTALDPDPSGQPEATRVPVGIDHLELSAPVPLEAWAHARARRDGNAVLVDIDLWGEAGERLAVLRGLRLAPLAPGMEDEVPSLPATGAPAILTRLAGAPTADRVDLLVDFIRVQVASVMNMELEEVEDSPDFLLIELGFDSLMAVELQRRLQTHLRFQMSPGADMGGFQYSTIGDLARLLLAEVIDLSPG
jgi:acyl transferase domain-containing protein